MTTLAAEHGVLPPHKYRQDELTELFAGLCVPDAKSHPLVRRLHGSARVATRHLALPIERYRELRGFTEANTAFLEVAVDLGAQAVREALAGAGLAAAGVDLIMSTTVTGVAVPSLVEDVSPCRRSCACSRQWPTTPTSALAVTYATIGHHVGPCVKTVQRACRVAEKLELLVRVLDGAAMSLERVVVLGHFARGAAGARWRSLPNFYAATVPQSLIGLAPFGQAASPGLVHRHAEAVDNAAPVVNSRPADVGTPPAARGNVRLPVGSAAPLQPAVAPYSPTTPFDGGCGHRPRRRSTERPDAAPRTTAHRQRASSRTGRPLDPSLVRFASDLRASPADPPTLPMIIGGSRLIAEDRVTVGARSCGR